MKFTSENNPTASGRARMAEIAKEMKGKTTVVVDAMILGLGRVATPLERLQAEAIAGLFLKAARKREQGKDDLDLLREAALLTNSSVFRSPHALPPIDPATEQKPV